MSFRAAGVANSGAAAVQTLAVTVPASTQVGDLVLVGFIWSGSQAPTSVTSSTGRTLTATIAAATASQGSSGLWTFVAQSGDAGSTVTLQIGANARMSGLAWAESNATGAIDATARGTFSLNTTTIPIPSVDPTVPNTRQIVFYGGGDSTTGSTNSIGTPSGGFTLRANTRSAHTTQSNVNIYAAGRNLPADTASSAETATASIALLGTVSMVAVVVPSNSPPVANAGSDQSVAPAATVTLNGTGSSDPEAGSLTYSWTQVSGPAVSLSSSTVAQPTFTAPASVDEATLVFGLTVTDPEAQASGQDTVTINVAPAPFMYSRQGGTWLRKKLYRRVSGAWVWP